MKVEITPEDRLAFTIDQSCQVTGLGRNSIYQLIGRGVLPSRKLGGRRLILREDLEAVLKSAPVTMPAE
jgi:excisionase family DNA binding protein